MIICIVASQMHKSSLACLNNLSQEITSVLDFSGHRYIHFVLKFLMVILYIKDVQLYIKDVQYTNCFLWCLDFRLYGLGSVFLSIAWCCCCVKWGPFTVTPSIISFQKSELCSFFFNIKLFTSLKRFSKKYRCLAKGCEIFCVLNTNEISF